MDTIDIDESMEDLPEMKQDPNSNVNNNVAAKIGGLAGAPPKIAVPSLNLSSLKHVREYTS